MSASEKRYLAICEHNVGRSQMLRAILEWLGVHADSAGTHPLFDEFSGPGPAVVASLAELDIQTNGYGIKEVSAELVEAATDVIVLCNPALVLPYILELEKTQVFELDDPRFVHDPDSMRKIRDMVGTIAYFLAADALTEVDSEDENFFPQSNS